MQEAGGHDPPPFAVGDPDAVGEAPDQGAFDVHGPPVIEPENVKAPLPSARNTITLIAIRT